MDVFRVLALAQMISRVIGPSAVEDFGPIPDKCEPRDDVTYRHCCIFPPFFTRDAAAACGARFMRRFVQEGTNVTGLRRLNERSDECTYWHCLLDKYYIMNADGLVNDDKFFTHLDKWVDLNPPFGEAMLNAKVFCKNFFYSALPLHPCEFFDFQKCIRNHVSVNCPVYMQTPLCLEQKAFYDECKEYYI